ncbi:hypothetical protein [Sphingopyxis sp. R3-92]|uniref:hypothetical protein n=1 Tax=Sphingopyxis sp. R3-92 TaxID=3158553 RepID=UPI003EE45D4C
MKTALLLSAITLFAASPAIAQTDDTAARRFEHAGNIYSYTVTQSGNSRVISGIDERSGKPFRLRVGERRVRGTVGTQQVDFALRDVKPLTTPATVLAAR